jgi:hypothetical protein
MPTALFCRFGRESVPPDSALKASKLAPRAPSFLGKPSPETICIWQTCRQLTLGRYNRALPRGEVGITIHRVPRRGVPQCKVLRAKHTRLE